MNESELTISISTVLWEKMYAFLEIKSWETIDE